MDEASPFRCTVRRLPGSDDGLPVAQQQVSVVTFTDKTTAELAAEVAPGTGTTRILSLLSPVDDCDQASGATSTHSSTSSSYAEYGSGASNPSSGGEGARGAGAPISRNIVAVLRAFVAGIRKPSTVQEKKLADIKKLLHECLGAYLEHYPETTRIWEARIVHFSKKSGDNTLASTEADIMVWYLPFGLATKAHHYSWWLSCTLIKRDTPCPLHYGRLLPCATKTSKSAKHTSSSHPAHPEISSLIGTNVYTQSKAASHPNIESLNLFLFEEKLRILKNKFDEQKKAADGLNLPKISDPETPTTNQPALTSAWVEQQRKKMQKQLSDVRAKRDRINMPKGGQSPVSLAPGATTPTSNRGNSVEPLRPLTIAAAATAAATASASTSLSIIPPMSDNEGIPMNPLQHPESKWKQFIPLIFQIMELSTFKTWKTWLICRECDGLLRALGPDAPVKATAFALKTMLNYSAETRTMEISDTSDECTLFYSHWCIANIFHTFVSGPRAWLAGGTIGETIPVARRTSYLVEERGKRNLRTIPLGRSRKLPDEFGHSPLQVDTLAFCLLCACDNLNSHGWYHNDISPDNILLIHRTTTTEISHILRGDIWALCDLGTSQHYPTGEVSVKRFVGNPINKSPEVTSARSDVLLISKNDLWGIGVVLYEVIVGKHPYHRNGVIDQYMLLTSPDPFLIPNEFVDGSTRVAALVPYLLERDCLVRPTAKEALLICGALMFLSPLPGTRWRRSGEDARGGGACSPPQLWQLPPKAMCDLQHTSEIIDLSSTQPEHIVKSIQFFTDNSALVETTLIQLLCGTLESMQPEPSALEPTPTVEQVCLLLFANEALSDVDAFCAVMLAFCQRRAVYYHVVATNPTLSIPVQQVSTESFPPSSTIVNCS